MAYIGKQPVVGNFQVCDAISVVNGQAAYTMQVGSTNVEPENANHMLVSLNGILQKPGSSFTISGSTITFASNLATGDVIDFIILLGDTLNVGTPSDDSVTAAKLATTSITGQTAETSVADDDLVLVSDTSASAALRKMTVSNLVANAGGGKVLQVVQGTKTDSTLSTSSSFVSTGLNVDITPSATSSKVLVMVSAYIDSNSGTVQKNATIYRDSTDLGSGTGGLTAAYSGAGRLRSAMNISILDSPSTTSQITYEMYMKNASGANIQINSESGKVTIIAMEIGA